MERIEIYQEVRTMQITYSFHFVFYLILGLEHLLFILKIFWKSEINLKLFISCSILDLIILFYPIIPLILMYRIILRINLTKIFKLLSLILIILSILIGILINIVFWINLKSTTSFFRECPYNLIDLKLFINEDDSSERCSKRRCVLESRNDNEGLVYNYICNYNSQNEFEIDPKDLKSVDGSINNVIQEIRCEEKNVLDDLFTDKNYKNSESEIYNYLQKCWNNVDIKNFYLCKRTELPNQFNIDENYNCPKDNYNTLLYLSGVFLIILDIILAFIPWSLDYKSYSRIMSFENNEEENVEINNNENDSERQRRRHNETNTSSNNPNSNNNVGNNENNNQNEINENNIINGGNSERNNDNEFNHQPTETIIIAKDKRTMNNSSNIRSDRLNSGLNSNNNSKSIANNSNSNSNINNDNNTNHQIGNARNINSMVSRSESQNVMISNSSQNQNGSEDIKINDNKKLILNNNSIIQNNNLFNNYNDEINFNNNSRYDNEEDEKDEEDKKSKNNCLIQNKNINLKNQQLIKNKGKINIFKNETITNSIIKDTNNTIITTIGLKKDENVEDTKNNDNFDEINKFEINEDINQDYQNKTPNKELKSININFSQVLTNLKESDQVTLFKNTNRTIIKEERKEESIPNKEEEKNNITHNDIKNQNNWMINPLKINNKLKDVENMEENKNNKIKIIKNDSQGSLLIESSNKELENMQKKENNVLQSNLINCTENE